MNIVTKSKEKYLLYEKRHQDILGAAIVLFNEKGFKAATTAAIAKQAGISEPTMYKHFNNKKDLFISCFQSIIGTILSKNKKIFKKHKDNELEYFRGISKVYYDFVSNNPDKSMFLVHMLSYQKDPEFRRIYLDIIEKHNGHLESMIQSAKNKGKIKSTLDISFLSAMFASQYFTVVAVKEFLDPEKFKYENFHDAMMNMLQFQESL